jgi:hypothetical protein
MKIEIENYRGWDISFDTDKETFYAQSDEYDRGETKKSFASAKQYIDDFIKDNLEFKPVWIETPPSSYINHSKIKLIGIRKDKRFVYEGKDGKKEQLSDYSEKDYILCNEANDAPYAELEECRKRKELIDEEMKVIEAKIIKVGLAELKAKYSI